MIDITVGGLQRPHVVVEGYNATSARSFSGEGEPAVPRTDIEHCPAFQWWKVKVLPLTGEYVKGLLARRHPSVGQSDRVPPVTPVFIAAHSKVSSASRNRPWSSD
jgi:hypothetical protein